MHGVEWTGLDTLPTYPYHLLRPADNSTNCCSATLSTWQGEAWTQDKFRLYSKLLLPLDRATHSPPTAFRVCDKKETYIADYYEAAARNGQN